MPVTVVPPVCPITFVIGCHSSVEVGVKLVDAFAYMLINAELGSSPGSGRLVFVFVVEMKIHRT
jgi:hypothetical protein